MHSKLIYVVDDEQNIRDLIKSYLIKEGYDVEVFADGSETYDKFKAVHADMVIMDIMMPGLDGYALCREIRNIDESVPIIMVSAKDEEIDRVLGLELGSDDYISKPFSPRELVARVKNIFKRIRNEVPAANILRRELRCKDVMAYPDERRIIAGSNEIELTAKEFDLVIYLIENRNRVLTRDQLITNIWGYDYIGDARAIDDLVKRVRKKLSEAGSILEIITVWGYGYKICD